MAPHYLPLINSVQELVESKEANPVVIKGFGTETLIAVHFFIYLQQK